MSTGRGLWLGIGVLLSSASCERESAEQRAKAQVAKDALEIHRKRVRLDREQLDKEREAFERARAVGDRNLAQARVDDGLAAPVPDPAPTCEGVLESLERETLGADESAKQTFAAACEAGDAQVRTCLTEVAANAKVAEVHMLEAMARACAAKDPKQITIPAHDLRESP